MNKLLALLCALSGFAATSANASFTVSDVGVIGLFSHDVFAWDNKAEASTENGRLDLSTIYDFDGGKKWEQGGNTKNSENAPVYTIAMNLVDHHKARVAQGMSFDEARRDTVKLFHKWVAESYERVRGKPLPAVAMLAPADNVDQAALRAMHDVLPGRIALFDHWPMKELTLTDAFLAKTRLSAKELAQPVAEFNGDYDAEYRAIKIPFTSVVIDLKEVDRAYIEKFSPYKQADMLAALAKVGSKQMAFDQLFFIDRIEGVFAKAICPEGNAWMPQDRVCQ